MEDIQDVIVIGAIKENLPNLDKALYSVRNPYIDEEIEIELDN